ncbi:MAG: fructose PTS transporter subunit IIA, partial [Actinomycetota bacterium]|nr:fructose PTS transporter subunit IIA [Actinomycetota bacterium]
MPGIIEESLVVLDLVAEDKHQAVRLLAERLASAGRVTDIELFLADVREREQVMPTGLEGGIGIPHARSEAVTTASLAFGRSPSRVDFGASDGPADLIFLIAAPAGGGAEHMTILASLARRLVHGAFREALRAS